MSGGSRYSCVLCSKDFVFKWEHHEHLHSYNHHKKLSSGTRNPLHHCICCQTTVHSIVDFANHIGTEKHNQNLQNRIGSIRYGEEKARQREKQRARNTTRAGRQNEKRRNVHRTVYQDWSNQDNGVQQTGDYIQLSAGNGCGKPTHASNANDWNRPFGYQYPYNQDNPQYTDYNTDYNHSYTDYGTPPPLLSLNFPNSMPNSVSSTTQHSPASTRSLNSSTCVTSPGLLSSTASCSTSCRPKASPRPVSSGSDSKVGQSGSLSNPSTSVSGNCVQKSSPVAAACDKLIEKTSDKKLSSKSFKGTDSSVGFTIHPENSTKKSSKPSSKNSPPVTEPSQSEDSGCAMKECKSSTSNSQRTSRNSSNDNAKSKAPRTASPSVDVIRKVKQEPQDLLSREKVSSKTKVTKKGPEAQRGSLQGLLQGRSTSRHLQYQLDKAVRQRRCGQGRNYNIESGNDTLNLPDSCELENVDSSDLGEVEALLGDVDSPHGPGQLEKSRDDSAPHADTLQAAGQSSTNLSCAGTADSTRAPLHPPDYNQSAKHEVDDKGDAAAVDRTPVAVASKKRKSACPPTSQTKKTKKAAQVQPKKVPKAKVAKAAKLKQTAITKTAKAAKKTKKAKESSSSPDVTASPVPAATEDLQLPTSTSQLQTEVEEKEGVITQLLALTMREESIRKELPELDNSIKEMLLRQEQLAEEQKRLEKNIELAQSKRIALSQEEEHLRKSRLDILTKAKDSAPKPPTSGWTVQADASSSDDLAHNTQYIGGFVTSDAAEEERMFSNLHEKVRHLSQSSDTESSSRYSVSSTKGLSKIEKKMSGIVQSQKRKSLQGEAQLLYEGHLSAIQHLVVKGEFLYSSSGDHTLRRFDLKTGACISTYYGHENLVKCFVVLSRQMEKLAIYSVDKDGLLLVFDVDTKCVLNRHSIGRSITCIVDAWGSLYLGLENGDIVSYSISDCSVSETYHTEESGIVCMCTAQEGARRLLICGSYDGRVSVRDVKSGLFLRQLPLNSSQLKQLPRCMTADDSRPYVYVCCSDYLRIYNYEKASLLKEFAVKSEIRGLSLHKDSPQLLFIACQDGKVCQYNTQSLEWINTYQMPHSLLAITCKKGTVYVGDSNGLTTSFQIASKCYQCQIGDCKLPYATKDSLIDHIFTAHVSDMLARQTCPWATCTSAKHHKSTYALKNHIYQKHLND